MEPDEPLLAPDAQREQYRLAKIEHYLREAEDCFQMARYGASERALMRVMELDPNNSAAESLSRRIEHQMTLLKDRNGHAHNGSGSVHPVRKKRSTVLVVDQDERVLIRLADQLKRFGFRIVSALNRREASEAVAAITPDLVISEVNFAEGPDGFDLFSSIRAQSHTRHTPFLFLANRIDRETLIAGKRLGVDDFLFKPVDSEVVAASVMNCLARGRREKALL